MAAALNPAPKRFKAPGRAVVVKKLAVSLIRRTAVSWERVPVSAIGRAEYLLRKVATKAPRTTKGARLAEGLRLARAPASIRLMSIQSGVASIARMKAVSSGGASGTASSPWSQAVVSMPIRRLKPNCGISAA